jgi:hypothetical protein
VFDCLVVLPHCTPRPVDPLSIEEGPVASCFPSVG